jgi:GNAT superfamily N-acetyltransferase
MSVGNRQDEIDLIEAMARDAWPAAQADWVSGWLFRFTYGITRRANSVWPNSDTHGGSILTLDEKLNEAELFYAIYEMPTRYQVSPASCPVDLDIALAMRGYQRSAQTAVQTATLDEILSETGRRLPSAGLQVDVTEQANQAWLQAYSDIGKLGKRDAIVRRDIIGRIRTKTGFALATLDGEPVALGLGVVNKDWLGIYSMSTDERMRRRGAAISIIHALANWAQLNGVRRSYLQVMTVNAPALALYARCGYSTLYHYHYREKEP